MRSFFIALALLFTVSCGTLLSDQDVCKADWNGAIDSAFLTKVKADLKKGKSCEKFVVTLYSPGGSVFDTLEVVREMEEAKKYQIVEVHGRTWVASGATFILGSGTKGHRFVHKRTVGLLHGIQLSNGWESQCGELKESPLTDNDKLLNALILTLIMEYADAAGKSLEEVFSWLECNNTQIGPGEMFVKLGLADHVEG